MQQEYYSLHTGEPCGFSWQPCDCCGSKLGGERYELHGLKPAATGGMESHELGSCCVDCVHGIDG